MNRVSNPEAATQTAFFLAALQRFVREHGGQCYRNWSAETLDDYFRFHITHGTLAWCARTDRDQRSEVGGQTAEICGVAVAWQIQSARLDTVCPTGRVVFDWTPNDPTGDCVWVADVVCTAPGAWLAMAKCFAARYPHWNGLPLFTYRTRAGELQRHRIPDPMKRLFQPQPSTSQGGY